MTVCDMYVIVCHRVPYVIFIGSFFGTDASCPNCLFVVGRIWSEVFGSYVEDSLRTDSFGGCHLAAFHRLERGKVYDDEERRFAYELPLPKLTVPIQGTREVDGVNLWTVL